MNDEEKTALKRAKPEKVWKVNLYIRDPELAKHIKLQAIEDGMNYSEMFMAGMHMYLASRRNEEEKGPLVP